MKNASDLIMEKYVMYHAQPILRCRSPNAISDRFSRWFGLNPFVFVQLWKRLIAKGLIHNAKVYHALWALLFLRMYVYEDLLSSIVGADRKTVRKWIWYMLQKISCLSDDVVSLRLLFLKIFRLYSYFIMFRLNGVTD